MMCEHVMIVCTYLYTYVHACVGILHMYIHTCVCNIHREPNLGLPVTLVSLNATTWHSIQLRHIVSRPRTQANYA